MGQYFSHDDAFPIIARLIADVYQRSKNYVTHDELVSAVIADTLGAKLILAAQSDSKGDRRDDWWAANMVAWFSKTITDNQSEYESCFDRKKIKRAWAYRPRDGRLFGRNGQLEQNSPSKPPSTSQSQVRAATPQSKRLSREMPRKSDVSGLPATTVQIPDSPQPSSHLDHLLEMTQDRFDLADRSKITADLLAAPISAVFKLAHNAMAMTLRSEAAEVFSKRYGTLAVPEKKDTTPSARKISSRRRWK